MEHAQASKAVNQSALRPTRSLKSSGQRSQQPAQGLKSYTRHASLGALVIRSQPPQAALANPQSKSQGLQSVRSLDAAVGSLGSLAEVGSQGAIQVPLSDVGATFTSVRGAVADPQSMAASWVSNQQHRAAADQVSQLVPDMSAEATHTA